MKVESFKGRTLSQSQLVECYRNLNKRTFSIRDKRTKLVTAIGDGFILHNVTTRVSEKSRLKVIQKRQKNVHAWLTGEYMGTIEMDTESLIELYYNPYVSSSFIRLDNMEAVHNIDRVYFKKNKCFMIL